MPDHPESEPYLSAHEEEEMGRLLRLTPQEAADELRAAGIDPDKLTRRLWAKFKATLAEPEEARAIAEATPTDPAGGGTLATTAASSTPQPEVIQKEAPPEPLA